MGEEVEVKSKRMTLKGIAVKVCREYGVQERELQKVSQNRKASEARSVIGFLCVQNGSATLTEVGKRFKRDVATISTVVRRVEQGVEDKINEINKGQVVKGNKPSLTLSLFLAIL